MANERIRGYHLNRLYSPRANIRDLIDLSTQTTPSAMEKFQTSALGEPFSPEGSSLSVNDLDRCREAYSSRDYDGEASVAGVDVGTRFHVVIRQQVPAKGRSAQRLPGRQWFAGDVSWRELVPLLDRFNVRRTVIDGTPEQHLVGQLAAERQGIALAYYTRHDGSHDFHKGRPSKWNIDRVAALDELMHNLRAGSLPLPCDARQLGGRVKDGYGEYYRHLLALKRTVEQNGQENWVARWVDNNKADHLAHAEVYCTQAARMYRSTIGHLQTFYVRPLPPLRSLR